MGWTHSSYGRNGVCVQNCGGEASHNMMTELMTEMKIILKLILRK